MLPFRVLRSDPEVDFLGLALADAVSSSLSGLSSLVVRSSAASSRFAVEAPDLPSIATQLDVDLVLMGTLLRSGDRLRVSTQLVEAPAGTLTWSHTTESEVGDLFRLQDELTQGIVASLTRSLGGPTRPERPGETPASARAYEFYLRGTEVARDWSQLQVARDLYLRCVAEDPGFAPAWARLGRAHRLIGKYLEIPELAAHQARAEEALRRALDLSPRLPLAHKLYAHLEAEVGRAQDAMVRLLRLAAEARNDAELFAGLVHACRYSGLLEASLAAHREAQRLDPHLSTGVVHTLWQRGEFEAVLEQKAQRRAGVARVRAPRPRTPRGGARGMGVRGPGLLAPDPRGARVDRRGAGLPDASPRRAEPPSSGTSTGPSTPRRSSSSAPRPRGWRCPRPRRFSGGPWTRATRAGTRSHAIPGWRRSATSPASRTSCGAPSGHASARSTPSAKPEARPCSGERPCLERCHGPGALGHQHYFATRAG